MTQPTGQRPTKIQALIWLLALLVIPAIFWFKNEIVAHFYNAEQCDEPRRREWRSFDVPIPAGYLVHGLDVSHYSCRIDWKSVKTMQMNGINVDFVFMRATRGLNLLDYQFSENWEGARRAGVLRGAYHFYTFSDDATSQARFFLQNVKIESGDLPPVLDIEDDKKSNDARIQKDVILRGIEQWLKVVEYETGVRPIIYTNQDYYKRYISGNFKEYDVWIASYNNLRGVALPDGRNWRFWQFTDKARCNGISEPVDMNVFSGDKNQLRNICKR